MDCVHLSENKTNHMKTQVIFARMRVDHNPGFYPFTLKQGELLPIDVSQSILTNRQEFRVMKRDAFGILSFTVPKEICTCVFRVMESQFNIGDIVTKGRDTIPFRVFGIKWNDVDFWLMDGWGISQKLASGALESDVRRATNEEIMANMSYIEYSDELMRRHDRFIVENHVDQNGI